MPKCRPWHPTDSLEQLSFKFEELSEIVDRRVETGAVLTVKDNPEIVKANVEMNDIVQLVIDHSSVAMEDEWHLVQAGK